MPLASAEARPRRPATDLQGWGVADPRLATRDPRAKSATCDPRPRAILAARPGPDICQMPGPPAVRTFVRIGT